MASLGHNELNLPYFVGVLYRSISIIVTSYGQHGSANHRYLDCSFNSLFSLTSKKKLKVNTTGNLLRESTDNTWIPLQRVSTLQWCHNGLYGINRLFGRRSKKTSKLRVTGLCAGNSPGIGEIPAQMASNTENFCIWWRHRVRCITVTHKK